MSDNRTDGRQCYAEGDAASRAWFEDQWKRWPTRVHKERTTNISFHHGGVLAFREIHGREPAMSRDFRSHVEWHDKNGVG